MRPKKTPALLISKKTIEEKYRELCEGLGSTRIHYALKANPHRGLAKFLHELGIGFEIASTGELKLLLSLGVPPGKIISSNPMKDPSFIKLAYSHGIGDFAFDSYPELEKLSCCAPGSGVYVRLTVLNEGSEWPLSRKFGVETDIAAKLLVQARAMGLRPEGIAFHVGSQCTEPLTWIKAIEKSRALWELVKGQGITLNTLNIGGGFPIRYTKPVPPIADVAKTAINTIRRVFPEDINIVAEPGRSLVGEAGVLVTTVIAKATRNGQRWVYLDVGVFNGLMESIGGIKYSYTTERSGAISKCVLAGPSCDSFDVISDEVALPDLDIGDRVCITSAGAYTTAYASRFNGFPVPTTYLV